jgi:hypothetical protein
MKTLRDGHKEQAFLQRSHAKLRWLLYPSKRNGYSLNNVGCEDSRHFGNKKKEYLKDIRSKNMNIRDLYRGVNEVNKGHQPRSSIVKDENGDLLADSRNILNMWKNTALS